MASTDTTRVVGRVVRPHGVRGDVVVEIHTDEPDERFASGVTLLTGDGRALTVELMRWHSRRLLVRFRDVADPQAAEALRGAWLTVDVSRLPDPDDPDEFHDFQLEGLTAVTRDGDAVGTVRDVVHTPGQDLLAIDAAGREVLVPFVRQIVPEVDLTAGRLVLDPPAGLLDVEP